MDASAINDAGQITGQGLINDEYHAYLLTPVALPGDFNNNGIVDAADYVAWRKIDGMQAGYNTWRTHFGQPSGSGSVASANATVPEPTTLVVLLGGCRHAFAASPDCIASAKNSFARERTVPDLSRSVVRSEY